MDAGTPGGCTACMSPGGSCSTTALLFKEKGNRNGERRGWDSILSEWLWGQTLRPGFYFKRSGGLGTSATMSNREAVSFSEGPRRSTYPRASKAPGANVSEEALGWPRAWAPSAAGSLFSALVPSVVNLSPSKRTAGKGEPK